MNSFTFMFILLTACFAVTLSEPGPTANMAGIPSCGLNCMQKASHNKKLMGKCSISNTACLCKNEPFQLSMRQCIVSQCSDPNKLKMIAYEAKVCPGQQLTGLPACGQLCLLRGAANKKNLGGCSGSDSACLCQSDAFQAYMHQCVTNTCSFEDSLAMLNWSDQTC